MKKIIALLSIKSNSFQLGLKIKLCAFCVLLFLIKVNANSNPIDFSGSLHMINIEVQDNTITGIVTGEDETPLPGVTIQVKGSSIGTITNFDGEYTIDVPNGGKTILVFVYLGMNTEEVVVGNQSTLNMTMTVDQTSLEEVVVIGYGTIKKKDLASAVSTVKTEDLVLSSSPSVVDVLRGKAAGLQITQNSAQPGGGLDILIRGATSPTSSNEPLIVVDGFPIANNFDQPGSITGYSAGTQSFLNSFNPNDIENISVLKDASALSIYGARAANGVILITTKKGVAGKVQVDYSSSFSYQPFNQTYDQLELPEWMQLRNDVALENWQFNNGVAPYGNVSLEDAIADPSGGVAFTRYYSDEEINNAKASNGTDWVDLVTQNGIIQQHNLSLRGGTETTKYFLSGNLFEQKGVLKNSDFNRASMRFNLDQTLNKYLKVGMNFTTSRIKNDNSQLGGDQFENSGLLRSALQYGPHIAAIDNEGNYPINTSSPDQPNPYSLLTITDESETNRTLANFFLEVRPFKGLVARFQGGIDQGTSTTSAYLPTTTLAGALSGGSASIGSVKKNDNLVDFTLTYNTTLNENHNFNFLAGSSFQGTQEDRLSSSSTTFITDAFLYNNLGVGTENILVTSSSITEELISFFGRINYNYKQRYIVSSSVRRDGSSRFGDNNKYAMFSSIAVAWNIAEEPFMASISDKISTLKLRIGYGELGNQNIESNWLGASRATNAYIGSDGEAILTAVVPSRLTNPDLKWETTIEKNIGLDFGFFNNRITGSFEAYDKVINDLLQFKTLDSYHYLNSVAANVGSAQGKGIELTLNTVNIDNKDFTWESTFTYSKYEDRWKERDPDWDPDVYESIDDPIRAQFSYLSDGIMQIGENVTAQPDLVPGQIKIKDVNGFQRDAAGNPMTDEDGRFLRTGEADGQIDVADTVLLGSSDPDFTAGLSNTFTYKNLKLNVHFNGVFGRQIIDQTDLSFGVSAEAVATNGQNVLSNIYDRWTPDNPSTTRPSSYYGYSTDGTGDFFYQDAWFIRCQNLSLSYTLPKKWLNKYINSASIRFDAQNLFIITPYTGDDPETVGFDPNLEDTELDSRNLVAAYPNVKTYTLGIDIKF